MESFRGLKALALNYLKINRIAFDFKAG